MRPRIFLQALSGALAALRGEVARSPDKISTPDLFFTTRTPIWVGVDKRGNRRNRSRFNYNR